LTAFARAAAVIRRRYLLGDLRRLLREELELAKIVIGLWCNRLYGASIRMKAVLILIVAAQTGMRSGSSERYLRDTAASQIICKQHRRQ
jgi:hypothetical protein